MANNRMFMRCDVCGEEIMIASHLGRPWSMDKSTDDLNSFFDRHYTCQVNMAVHENKKKWAEGKHIWWDNQDYYSVRFESRQDLAEGLPKGVEPHFINCYTYRMGLDAPDKLYKTAYDNDGE